MRIQSDLPVAAYRRRALRFTLVAMAVCLMLIGRLGYLQFFKGPSLRAVSTKNYVRTLKVTAQRGTIVDREGKTLAVHRPTYDLFVVPSQINNVSQLLVRVRETLPLDELVWLELSERIREPRGMWRHQPILVHKDLDRDEVSRIESLRAQVTGLKIKTRYRREYPHGEVGAHLLGYLGKPTAKELREKPRYHIDSMLGRSGVERVLEEQLAGQDGYERFAVNARGAREKSAWAEYAMDGIARRDEPKRGHDVQLTIDGKIQSLLVKAMRRAHSGAAVILDVRTGEVLGLVSKPTYDPNSWSGRLTRQAKEKIDSNPYKPMVDKSMNAYFPGSVYKVVTAFAGMDLDMLDPEELIESPGAYEFGNRIFHCHKRSGHGRISLPRALAASADVYFYKLGEAIGIDRLADYGLRFGFGRASGLKINGDATGLIPTKAYHDEATPGGFQYGLSLSTAVGQGDVRTTPLQMAVAYAALANGGQILRPFVIKKVTRSDGTVVSEGRVEVVNEVGGSEQFLSVINQGLAEAVQDEKYGTAKLAATSRGTLAGKTGTAQVRKLVRRRNRQTVSHFRERDHAWFAGFAPLDDPKISLVIFLEHGGSGGKKAAPIARQILEQYDSRIRPLFARKTESKKRGSP